MSTRFISLKYILTESALTYMPWLRLYLAGFEVDAERHLVERDERAEINEFYSAPRCVEPSHEIDEIGFTPGRVEPSHEIDEIDFTPGRVEPSHEINEVSSTSESSVEIGENQLTLSRVDELEMFGRVNSWVLNCPDRIPDDELVLSGTDYSGLSNALGLLAVAVAITAFLVTVIWFIVILYKASWAKDYPLAKS